MMKHLISQYKWLSHLKLLPIILFSIIVLGIAGAETVKVLRVKDGDTCLLEDGRTVRYLSINTPEEGDKYFQEASLANNKLVGGKEVRLEFWNPKQDKYGRVLAYVFVNDTFVNQELLLKGYAHINRPVEEKYKNLLLKAQEEARISGLGIWKHAKDKNIAIPDVHPKETDKKNLNSEFIVIENFGDTPIDLTGWTVSDEANHRYLFPNYILQAKGKVTLRTGLGKNSLLELFWGSGKPIWNNDGDTIFIRDAEGNLILCYIY